jgi:exosome complex component RRP45
VTNRDVNSSSVVALQVYTEFSPMADPNFEAGKPGEAAVELGRIVDRGLR